MSKTSLGKAYVQIVPSADGISGSISKVLNGESTSAGLEAGKKIAGGIIKMILAAGIGTAITASIKKSITEGAALEQSIGGIETLFKANSDKVIANSKQAYKTAGMSANAYMELTTSFAASLLQSVAGDTAKAADIADMAMTDMSDNANKMGTDMESIKTAYQGFAKQNYTMLDNLKLGYGGTKEEMGRLLTDAQKLSGVQYDITNLSDVYNAIHVIQNELDITGTTAKEAASTFSGSLSAMKAAAQNVMGQLMLGEDIQPALDGLKDTAITFINNNLLPAIVNILKNLPTTLSDLIVGIAPALIPSLMDCIAELLASISLSLGDLMTAGGDIIAAIISGAGAVLPDITALGTKIVAWTADSFVTGVPKIIAASTELLSGIVQAIPDVLAILRDNIPDLFNTIIWGMKTAVPLIADAVLDTVEALVSMLPEIIDDLVIAMTRLMDSVITSIKDYIPVFAETAFKLLSGLIDAIPVVIDAILPVLPGLISTIITFLIDAIPLWMDATATFFKALLDALPQLTALLPGVIATLGETIITLIIDNAPLLWEAIKTLIAEYIAYLGEEIAARLQCISDIFEPLVTWFDETIITPIKDFFRGLWESISGFFVSLWEDITAVFTDAATWFYDNVISPVTEFFRGVWEDVSGFFVDLWNDIVETFHTVIDPWIEIIKRAASLVYDDIILPIKEFFQALWDDITAIYQDVKTWIDDNIITPVVDTVKGFWEDIKAGAEKLWSDITAVFGAVSGWFDDNIVKPVKDAFGAAWEKLSTGASDAWQSVKDVFGSVSGWFEDVFAKAWQKVKDVFSTGGEVFDGIKEGISSVFTTVVNAIIKGINNVIKVPFDAINSALQKIHDVTILGVNPFSYIHTIDVPEIPLLAKGTIVDSPLLAMLGEAGKEAVIPLENNTGWMQTVAQKITDYQRADYSGSASGANSRLDRIITLLTELLAVADTLGPETTSGILAVLRDLKFEINDREFARLVRQVQYA